MQENVFKAKYDSNATKTRNIILESKVAELLKENETLEIHCKDLCESIEDMKTKAIEQTNSLITKK